MLQLMGNKGIQLQIKLYAKEKSQNYQMLEKIRFFEKVRNVFVCCAVLEYV